MATRGGQKGKGKKDEAAAPEVLEVLRDIEVFIAGYTAQYADPHAALRAASKETPVELRKVWGDVLTLDKELEDLEKEEEKMEDVREDLLRWVEEKAAEDYMVPKEDGAPDLRVVKDSPYEEHAETVVSLVISFCGRRYAEHVLADAAEEEKEEMKPVFSGNGALTRPLWQYMAGEHPKDVMRLRRMRASINRR
ncbi:hypothetical protein BU16DRAFT_557415 [Lophium mytilinum]|uniref:Uncharacterized protein n=1 Tax=Lophium mytilinum TaxID=390894 RepID=A0A6A6R425_9PEZI|nr:hypothetical protein BU16DRAFT_557415 [Lophium mytilinum]